MTVNIRGKRHKLNIVLPFLGILFLTLVQKVSSTSGEHVCLKWKIQDTKLVLICKVDALNFPITFYDPFNTETGFCVPHKPCISLLDNANITKNSSQHEFIFTIPLTMKLNGWWICTYGHNIEKATTEVTLQDIPSTDVREVPSCLILMMLWCLFGYACSVWIICLFLSCKENPFTLATDSVFNCDAEGFCRDKNKTGKQVCVIGLSVTLFVLPLIVGLTAGERCIVPETFLVFGAAVGIVNCVVLINMIKKDQSNNQTEVQNSQPPSPNQSNNQTEVQNSQPPSPTGTS